MLESPRVRRFAVVVLSGLLLAPLLAGCGQRAQPKTPDSVRTRMLNGDDSVLGELAAEKEKAMPLLLTLLKDNDPQVVANAAMLIGKLERKIAVTAIPALVEAMKMDAVRTNLEYTIQDMGKAAIPYIVQALQSSDPTVRKYAAKILSRGTSKAAAPAVPALIQIIETGDDDAKTYAILALASIGTAATPAIPAIQDMMNSSSGNLKKQAKNAIKRIEDAKKPGMYTPGDTGK